MSEIVNVAEHILARGTDFLGRKLYRLTNAKIGFQVSRHGFRHLSDKAICNYSTGMNDNVATSLGNDDVVDPPILNKRNVQILVERSVGCAHVLEGEIPLGDHEIRGRLLQIPVSLSQLADSELEFFVKKFASFVSLHANGQAMTKEIAQCRSEV